MIGRRGERGSGISVLAARHDDDDDMYKEDLALNNRQWLIYHKIQPNQIVYIIYVYKEDLALNNLQWLIYHKA